MNRNYLLFVGLLLLAFPLAAQPGNYLVNGGFEDDFRGWGFYSDLTNGADVNFTLETDSPIDGAKSVRMDINGAGTEPFHAALEQRFTIHKDQEVELIFKVQASTETFINLEVCRAYGDFNPIIRSNADIVATSNIAVGPTAQTLSYRATSSYSDANYKLSLMVGNVPTGATIWVDSVVIHQTEAPWDGNILPNPELNEIFPRDSTLPAMRTTQLTYSATPWLDGGWEGGFADPAVTDLGATFGVDSSGVLSGPNSFYIDVDQKGTADFWHGFNFIFFWAHAGETYEYSMDVKASEVLTFSTAMNEEPWGANGDHFFLDVNATTDSQRVTIQTTRPLDNTVLHKVFQANLPVGNGYQIYLDNLRLQRLGAADTADFTTSREESAYFQQVKVYPNPSADGTFFIDLAANPAFLGKEIQVSLFDLQGKALLAREMPNVHGTLELATVLPRGVYVLRLQVDQGVFLKKVLIE